MVAKRGLPEEMSTLLKQLVMNGQVRMAGHVLYAYCRRIYGVDDETAARWIVIYFRREFPTQLDRHERRISKSL